MERFPREPRERSADSALLSSRQNSPYAALGIRVIFTPDSMDPYPTPLIYCPEPPDFARVDLPSIQSGSFGVPWAFFPYLIGVRPADRATEFKQRCAGLGIRGVTLHSYRYAWAERAKVCG
jgi:hypothetical protein